MKNKCINTTASHLFFMCDVLQWRSTRLFVQFISEPELAKLERWVKIYLAIGSDGSSRSTNYSDAGNQKVESELR